MDNIPHLCFHSVAPKKDTRWYRSYQTVEMHHFESLIQYLQKKNFRFLTYDEFTNHVHRKINTRYRSICLSFDDGYLDNYVFVYPLLKKYGIKATIFVNPDYVQGKNEIRQTLEDVWQNKCKIDDLETLGFVSWEELKMMQNSGLFEVQSHTMTHTKYFVSDKIVAFHNPRADYLYPIANLFPERKAYYMTDAQFMYLIPFGTPFFEEKSSVVAKKITINQQFIDECVGLLNFKTGDNYIFNESFDKVKPLYKSFKENNTLIKEIETDSEYIRRVTSEIVDSKRIIEERLQKPVYHLCWPHGVYNEFCHKTALDAGYKTTTIYHQPNKKLTDHTLIMRNGFIPISGSVLLSNLKMHFKINSAANVFPYDLIHRFLHNTKISIKY